MPQKYVPTAIVRMRRVARGGPFGWCYLIQNTLNGKGYVGQSTNNPRTRLSVMKSQARHGGKRRIELVSQDMEKYGVDAFVFKEKWPAVDQADLNRLEREKIQECMTLVPHGYNIEPGGRGKGFKRSPHVGIVVGMAQTGKPKKWSAETRAHMANKMMDRFGGLHRRDVRRGPNMDRSNPLFVIEERVRCARRAVLRQPSARAKNSKRSIGGAFIRNIIARGLGYRSWRHAMRTAVIRERSAAGRGRCSGMTPYQFRTMWEDALRSGIERGLSHARNGKNWRFKNPKGGIARAL